MEKGYPEWEKGQRDLTETMSHSHSVKSMNFGVRSCFSSSSVTLGSFLNPSILHFPLL